jgi:hypothetical protein
MTKALVSLVARAGAVIAGPPPAPLEIPPPLTPEQTLHRRTIGGRGAGDLSFDEPVAPSTAQRP